MTRYLKYRTVDDDVVLVEIEERAEIVWRELDDEERRAARRVFLNLVTPGPLGEHGERMAEDASRRAWQAEWDETTRRVVQKLVNVRLLTAGQDPVSGQPTVEVAHEALIRAWPRLQQWLADYRPFMRWYDAELAPLLRHWLDKDRHPDFLLPESMLAQTQHWMERYPEGLSGPPEKYIQASVEKHEQEQAAQERRRRQLTVAAVGAAVIFLVLALLAWGQRNASLDAQASAVAEANYRATAEAQARQNAGVAATAEAEARDAQAEAQVAATAEAQARQSAEVAATAEAEARQDAELQADLALSRQLAAQSANQLSGSKWEAAMLVAIEAGRAADTLEAFAALRQVIAHPGRTLMILSGHTRPVEQAVWNADESRILTASGDGTARVWDARTGEELVTLLGHTDRVEQAVWNSDESRILTASGDNTARVWDAETGDELLTLSGHSGDVSQAVWNSDENRILTASDDGTAQVWDAETGEELVTLSGHTSVVYQAMWNSDESRIVTASGDGTARVWDAKTGEELLTLSGPADAVWQAVWNSDGSRILIAGCQRCPMCLCSGGIAQVWDASTGEGLITLSHSGDVSQAVWNSDESRILTAGCERRYGGGCSDGTARVWDAETGEELVTLLGHTDRVNQAAWNADESRILTASADGTARVWDARTGEELLILFGHTGTVWQAVWNGDESRILTAGCGRRDTHGSCLEGTARVWDAETGEELVTLLGHTDRVNQAMWNSDETRILTTGCEFFNDYVGICVKGTARVWDAETGEELVILSGHGRYVARAVWNSDETRILTVGCDRFHDYADVCVESTARVWDARTGEELVILPDEGRVEQAVWNSDESRILTVSWDGTARVWDARTGEELVILPDEGRVEQAVWSSDESRILTVSGDGAARVWDARTGEELLTLSSLEGDVWQAVWNSDGSRILTAGCGRRDAHGSCVEGTARVWDAETGEELVTLSGHEGGVNQAMWNSDESRILTTSWDNTARVWDARTGEELVTLLVHTSWAVRAVWNGDGSRILTVGCARKHTRGPCLEGTARVWDAETGEELVTLLGHTDDVNQAVWNSDETRILTASRDGTARVWDARTGEELITLLGHTSRVVQAVWNADESRILTASADGTVRLWYTRMQDLLKVACQRASRNMTPEEWQRFMKHEPDYRPTCPNLAVPEE